MTCVSLSRVRRGQKITSKRNTRNLGLLFSASDSSDTDGATGTHTSVHSTRSMSYVATSTGDHRVPNKLDRPRSDETLEDEFQRTVWDEVGARRHAAALAAKDSVHPAAI